MCTGDVFNFQYQGPQIITFLQKNGNQLYTLQNGILIGGNNSVPLENLLCITFYTGDCWSGA